jgi:5-hydroxyisourate hydrolase
MSTISTHVLDTARGRPAEGIDVSLERIVETGSWHEVGRGTTNADGRVKDLVPGGRIEPGRYRITFETAPYLARQGALGFYPFVQVVFEIGPAAAGEHFHVPLLLSPWGFSTYRGS